VRAKPEKFADHYTQAALFWNSQTPIERDHIVRAYRFELSRVQTPAIRARVVALLANVASELAAAVADGLGIAVPHPLPKIIESPPEPEVTRSSALSLFARPGDGTIRARRIAILVADGVQDAVTDLQAELTEHGAVPRFVGVRLGAVTTAGGEEIEVDATLETTPAVLYDALIVPDGKDAVKLLGTVGHAAEFIKDQYRHCKAILAIGAGRDLVENAGVFSMLASGEPDPGLLAVAADELERATSRFIAAVAAHRHFERQVDPPIL
jgi:catalase